MEAVIAFGILFLVLCVFANSSKSYNSREQQKRNKRQYDEWYNQDFKKGRWH